MLKEKLSYFQLSGNEKVQLLCAIYLISFINDGVVKSTPIGRTAIFVGVFAVWSALVMLKDNKQIYNSLKGTSGLIVFSIIVLLGSFYVNESWNRYFYACLFAIPIVMMANYYMKKENEYQTKLLILYCFLEIIFVSINTIYVLIENPMIVRYITAGNEMDIKVKFISSFGNIYANSVLVIFLTASFKQIKKVYKPMVIISIISCVGVIASANFATAILFTILFLAIISITKKKKNLLFQIIIFAGIFAIFKEKIAEMCYLVSKWEFLGEFISRKMMDLSNSLLGIENADNTMNTRSEFIKDTIKVFRQYPILGLYARNQVDAVAKVHNHNVWFDLFANFGILRSIPILIFMYRWIKKVMNRLSQISYGVFASYLMVFVLGFFNPVLRNPMFVALVFVIPLSDVILKKHTQNELSE